MGDQTVFSGTDVRVHISGYDAIDLEAREPSGGYPAEPPIHVVVGATVEINDGKAEGRLPGLRVFGEGAEMLEIGSAAVPQKFSFQYQLRETVHGRGVDLEFRYQGSSFTLAVAPPVVELVQPGAEATLAADEALVLEWTGLDAAPERAFVSARGQNCALGFEWDGEVTFVPERDESGKEPPCRFEVSAWWMVEVANPPSPFRSLHVERSVQRIQRFTVR